MCARVNELISSFFFFSGLQTEELATATATATLVHVLLLSAKASFVGDLHSGGKGGTLRLKVVRGRHGPLYNTSQASSTNRLKDTHGTKKT
jgi:hypothetical protein